MTANSVSGVEITTDHVTFVKLYDWLCTDLSRAMKAVDLAQTGLLSHEPVVCKDNVRSYFDITHLILQIIPLPITCGGEIEGGEGETNFPEELVPPKPVPVPHAQPQGTGL